MVRSGGGLQLLVAFVALTVGTAEAPATVAEQRARLPPAAECESPIAGRWKALVYSYPTESWYEHNLEIHQDPKDPTILTGSHRVDAWIGTADDAEPKHCIQRQKGKMVSSGTFSNGEVSFRSQDYETVAVVCGFEVGYNPDHFTGRLEPERQEFQAVNNDGGAAVNEPAVFRRIGCLDDAGPKAHDSKVAPPAFFPKRRTGGC
ncbi:MAG: hypothetical protein AB7O24_01585 [Kofleriaceae bacterium]